MITPRKNMPYINVLLLVTLFAISIQKVECWSLVEPKNESSGVLTSWTAQESAYHYDYGCSEGEFDCGGDECVLSVHVCDNVVDCDDGKDEENCISITKACGEDEFDCGEHFCIAKEKVCDGFLNCHNSLDERNCAPRNPAAQTTTATTTESITTQTTEEDDYEYEADCNEYEYACQDALCINKTQLCDGEYHCVGGEDELDCPKPSPSETTESLKTSTIAVPACNNSEFKCSNERCIESKKFCDGKDDCGDNSDEKNCQGPSEATESLRTSTITAPACNISEFRCLNERCIESNKLCDGKDDCGDNSDEKNCQATTTSIILKKVLITTHMTVPPSGCTYKGKWYKPESEIVPGECSGITCTSSGRVRKWEDPTCAGCISAKMNSIFLLMLAAICMLANLR